MTKNSQLKTLTILCTLLSSSVTFANQYEVSAMIGQMYGSDLVASDNSDITTDSGGNFSLGFAWQESNNGQGQILLNHVSHDFKGENGTNESVDVTYAHFNGVALFRQQNYVTTLSLGVGGAYFDANKGSEELYPSASVAFGTRYEFEENMALVTELRAYASLIDEDDALFCQQEVCSASFTDSLWIDSSISIGLAIKF